MAVPPIRGRCAGSTCRRVFPTPHSRPGAPGVAGGFIERSVAMRSGLRDVADVAIVGGTLLAATLSIGGCVARGAQALPETSCPGGTSPNPNVLLCENFEENDFQKHWDIGGHQGTWPVSQFVLCTDDSFGFHSRCSAWTNRLVFDNEWGFYGSDGRRN